MLRSFIAIDIPEVIQKAIATISNILERKLPNSLVRWVPSKNIHLTLQFLGNVTPATLERLSIVLSSEVANITRFEVAVAGAGVFPSPARPRILWVGLKASESLPILQHQIQAVTAQMGIPQEDRPFSPHLTIGRVNQNASFSEYRQINQTIKDSQIGILGNFLVDTIHLYKSELQPLGAIYTRLYTLPLAMD